MKTTEKATPEESGNAKLPVPGIALDSGVTEVINKTVNREW